MDYETFITKYKKLEDVPLDQFIKKEGIAYLFMEKRYKDIKINQLRNFFAEVNKIKKEKVLTETNRAKLEMNLAYDYGRNVITKDFYQIITLLLERIKDDDPQDFELFFEMVKSLIAYHKYHSNK